MPRPLLDRTRILVLLAFLFFFFVVPDSSAPSFRTALDPSEHEELKTHLAAERAALTVLNSSSWSTRLDPYTIQWPNSTGLRSGNGFRWDRLEQVLRIAETHFTYVLPANVESTFSKSGNLYRNVTGVVRGPWVRSEAMKFEPMNNSALFNVGDTGHNETHGMAENAWRRNVSATEGRMRIELAEPEDNLSFSTSNMKAQNALARPIQCKIAIRDVEQRNTWDARLYGIHMVEQGRVVLTTTSDKFAGIFALPHFTTSQDTFELSRAVLVDSISDVIAKQESHAHYETVLNPWSSVSEDPTATEPNVPQCELIAVLQVHPAKGPLVAIESELRFPTGRFMPSIPDLTVSAFIYSPDCDYLLETKGPPRYAPEEGHHLMGKKVELYTLLARRTTLAFAALVCGQIFLLKGQMEASSTPSAKSRLSFYTMSMLALGDGFASMSFLVAGVFINGLYLPLIATAFLAFLCTTFFAMKFLMEIWTVQAPEREASQTPSSPHLLLDTDALPTPVTAPTPTIPTASAPPSTRQQLGSMYTRFYFTLLVLLFLSLHATSWPARARAIYSNTLTFVYLSFWLPQIYRNAVRNCRRAVLWQFVLGQSVARVAPFVYLNLHADNVLFVGSSPGMAAILVAWIWCQGFVLAVQDVLGPRVFVPAHWLPEVYDYHSLYGWSPGETGSREFDCVICTEQVSVVGAEEKVALAGQETRTSGLFAHVRKAFMLTPCRHVFHTTCLEHWMRYRLQCPVCREDLPPI